MFYIKKKTFDESATKSSRWKFVRPRGVYNLRTIIPNQDTETELSVPDSKEEKTDGRKEDEPALPSKEYIEIVESAELKEIISEADTAGTEEMHGITDIQFLFFCCGSSEWLLAGVGWPMKTA